MLALSFWEAIWLVFVIFVFITALTMVVLIVIDIFRNEEMSAGKKALWLIALVLFTLIAVLVYVIVHGQGMTARQVREQAEAKESYEQRKRDIAGGGAASELERAAALHNAGKLSDDEYEALKAKIIS